MPSAVTGVELGFAIGAVPTVSMAVASVIMSSMEVSPATESMVQYFASGLILAAVALELFPLLSEGVTPKDSMVGITVGMFVGLLLVYGMEYILSLFDNEGNEKEGVHGGHEHAVAVARERHDSLVKSFGVDAGDVELAGAAPAVAEGGASEAAHHNKAPLGESSALILPRMPTSGIPNNDVETLMELQTYKAIEEDLGEWNDEDIAKSHEAILNPRHRSHVYEHLKEIADQVSAMEFQSILLMDTERSAREQEEIAEKIDEGVHSLQYLLDHSRRLVEGAESEITGVSPKVWMTDDRKSTMRRRVSALKYSAQHLMQHLQEGETIDLEVIKEVHWHMDDMDKQINLFHDSVQRAASRWHRKAHSLPEVALGDKLPMNLVVPVTLDCFIDGFLIGVTCALSPRAGIILGIANCLEMGFLGLAYAVRLKKCTGSSLTVRYTALYAPCAVMFFSSGMGAAVAVASHSVPAVFVGFVAFGIVALLALVCTELLIEAKAAVEGEERWYSSIYIFIAVYLVLMIEKAF